MEFVKDEDGRLATVEFDDIELQELVAFEATCACVIPRTRHAFLEGVGRSYGIPQEEMQPLLTKKVLSREDVWTLQILKRTATGNQAALGAIVRLRQMEEQLGRDVLHLYADRRRKAP